MMERCVSSAALWLLHSQYPSHYRKTDVYLCQDPIFDSGTLTCQRLCSGNSVEIL